MNAIQIMVAVSILAQTQLVVIPAHVDLATCSPMDIAQVCYKDTIQIFIYFQIKMNAIATMEVVVLLALIQLVVTIVNVILGTAFRVMEKHVKVLS